MLVEFDTYNYRHAEEILNSRLSIFREIKQVIEEVKGVNVGAGKDALTPKLCEAFLKRGWRKEAPVLENQPHEQRFDLFKERVAIEIEFSRYEFVYRDYIRFLAAYNADKIDVGVLITHSDSGLSRVKYPSIAPSLTRVMSDLHWLRPVVTVPIWVVALK